MSTSEVQALAQSTHRILAQLEASRSTRSNTSTSTIMGNKGKGKGGSGSGSDSGVSVDSTGPGVRSRPGVSEGASSGNPAPEKKMRESAPTPDSKATDQRPALTIPDYGSAPMVRRELKVAWEQLTIMQGELSSTQEKLASAAEKIAQLESELLKERKASGASATTSGAAAATPTAVKEVEEAERKRRRGNVMLHATLAKEDMDQEDEGALEKVKVCISDLCEREGLGQQWGCRICWEVEYRTSTRLGIRLRRVSPALRSLLFSKLKRVARAELSCIIDDDLTLQQQEEREERREKMHQLWEEGKQPSWRGSEVVWKHEKGHWVTEAFEARG